MFLGLTTVHMYTNFDVDSLGCFFVLPNTRLSFVSMCWL